MNSNLSGKTNNNYCCVPQCKSKGSRVPNVSFHKFPNIKSVVRKTVDGRLAIANRREEWRRILRIGKEVSNRMTVCSKHFDKDAYTFPPEKCQRPRLKASALPTLFLPITSYSEEKMKLKKEDSAKRLARYSEINNASVAVNTVPEPKPATQDASCFILECVSDHNKTSTENIIDGKRNPLFLPQKNDQPFEKWKKMIPKKDEILSSTDRVTQVRFEEGCIKTDFEFDVSQQSDDFFKLSTEVKNIKTPNSWWSVACTEDCIIFAKWNSKFSSERRVVICHDLSMKTFLMNVEVPISLEVCTIENLSQLLQKVDDFVICENADAGTSSGCLGFVVDKRQEFCRTCYESKKEKDAQRRNDQISVGKKTKSFSQVKNINERNTYPRKRFSDLNSELVESKHQCSQTKEVFLEAISHLSNEQQAVITSCHSFKTWFL